MEKDLRILKGLEPTIRRKKQLGRAQMPSVQVCPGQFPMTSAAPV
jgi:hypothetical protein